MVVLHKSKIFLKRTNHIFNILASKWEGLIRYIASFQKLISYNNSPSEWKIMFRFKLNFFLQNSKRIFYMSQYWAETKDLINRSIVYQLRIINLNYLVAHMNTLLRETMHLSRLAHQNKATITQYVLPNSFDKIETTHIIFQHGPCLTFTFDSVNSAV